MLSQAVPPIASRPDINSLDSQSSVPPLSTLPHWTRVNPLARTCPPKPLLRDRLQRLPNTNMSSSAGPRVADSDASLDAGSSALDDLEVRSSASDCSSGRRAFYLEHCIAFLKQEHSEILSALHEEVDRLKRDNRDLQFRLTLAEDRSLPDLAASQHFTSSRPRLPGSAEKKLSKSSDSAVDALERKEARKSSAQRPGSRAKAEEQKDRSLEAELLDLRQALKDEKHRNLLLEEQLERARSAGVRGAVSAAAVGGVESSASRQHFAPRPPAQPRNSADRSRRTSATQLNISTVDIPAGNSQNATGNVGGLSVVVQKPLTVSPVESASSLASLNTVDECKEFIRRLELENSRQADELHRLKQDLHEALYSHKWTPDAFLLAKAYLATDSDLAAGPHQSQRVPLRPNLKKGPDTGYNAHESLSLPRVKIAFGTKTVDRSKRLQQQQQQQQLLTRTRLDRDLLSSHDASDGH